MTRILKHTAAVAAIFLASGVAAAHPHGGHNTTTIKGSGNGTGNTIQVHNGNGGGHRGGNTTTIKGSGNGTGNVISVGN